MTFPSLKKVLLFPAWDGREWFQFLFLSALYGIILLRIFLVIYTHDLGLVVDSMNDVCMVYILGWTLFPVTGILFSWFAEWLRQKRKIPTSVYYPLFIVLNFVLMLLVLHPSFSNLLSGLILLAGFLFFQILGALLTKFIHHRKGLWERIGGRETLYYFMAPLLAVWLISLPCNWEELWGAIPLYRWVFFAWVVWLFHYGISKRPGPGRPGDSRPSLGWGGAIQKSLLYGLVLFCIAYLVIDPKFRYSLDNVSFYLGPLADMAAGKSLMVNIIAQYGILVFYFLRLIFHFLPMGFTSFTLVGYTLMVLQYLLFYFIVRQLFHSRMLAFFCLLALLLINYYFSQYFFREFYPSGSPLRFGFIYLLTALVVFRNRHPSWKRKFFFLESAVAAVACLWSFEVCVYTVPAYAGLAFCESLEYRDERPVFHRADLGFRSWIFLGFASLMGLLICLHIFWTSHEWPHLSYYWDYLSAYQGGVSRLHVPGFGYWWILIGILYFSFFTLLGLYFDHKKKNPPVNLNAATLLTFYGITQFFYFLYRAHPNNLLAISMPSFLLLVYWLYHLRQGAASPAPAGIRRGVYTLVILVGGFCLSRVLPMAVDVLQEQMVPLPVFCQRLQWAAQDLPRQDAFALQANKLMEKYSGGQKALIYFFGLRDLEVSLYTGHTEKYPYNDVNQASAFRIPRVMNRVLDFDPHCQVGDYIYFSRDMNQVDYGYDLSGMNRDVKVILEQRLLLRLSMRYDLRFVEEKDGIFVYRVMKRNPA